MPIECSSQNISIYQKFFDANDILRETFSGESNNCEVLSNKTTLSLTILPSTYYVVIDPNFAMRHSTLEPLSGISKYKWTFFTGNFFKLTFNSYKLIS